VHVVVDALDDAPFDAADPTRPAKAPKPRDAATLILVRKARGEWTVLMGQRARGHVFMPDKWVFPGGRVERSDAVAAAASELRPDVEAKLVLEKTRRAPRAFALAAVRVGNDDLAGAGNHDQLALAVGHVAHRRVEADDAEADIAIGAAGGRRRTIETGVTRDERGTAAHQRPIALSSSCLPAWDQ
jgi:hypothetical protein